jgi:hypothetical protein
MIHYRVVEDNKEKILDENELEQYAKVWYIIKGADIILNKDLLQRRDLKFQELELIGNGYHFAYTFTDRVGVKSKNYEYFHFEILGIQTQSAILT